MWIYHILYVHPSADGHFECIHLLATMNSAALNMSVQICLQDPAFSSSVSIPRHRSAQSYGNCSTVWGTIRLFATAAALFYIPTTNVQQPQFLQFFSLFYCSHPNGYEVVSLCDFHLYFPIWLLKLKNIL